MKRRFFRSRLIAIPALAVIGLGTWAVIASASGSTGSKAGAKAGLYGALHAAAQNTLPPGALAPSDAEMLPAGAAPTSVDVLGTLRGRSFYAVSLSDGRRCVASGPAASTSYRFGFVRCSTADASGASLADLSIYSFRPAGDVHLVRLEGLAANGVAAIEVLGRGGSLLRTPVVANKFAAAVVPQAPVVALAALDAAGNRVATVRTKP